MELSIKQGVDFGEYIVNVGEKLLDVFEAGSIVKSIRGSETFCSLDRKQILLQRSSAMKAAAC